MSQRLKRACWKVHDRQHSFSAETWMELYNSRVTDNKEGQAVYIDLEDEEETDTHGYSQWSELPDLLLERIFSYLTIRQKYYASLVCKSWYRGFYLQGVWAQFTLSDTTLTRGRFNYYSGWQYVLDHLRTQTCLSQVGRFFRHLTFDPMLNFYNLYEFMNMISWYTEQTSRDVVETDVGKRIRSLKFTFPCNMSTNDETERIRLFGTGGKLLDALKRLMKNLKELRKLELIDLMLDSREAQHLLDGVAETCCLTLRTLVLVNATRVQYQILHAGVFLNLHVLVISPQNLGDDLVELIGFTRLKHVHVVQNRYSPDETTIKRCSAKSWKSCKKNNPNLCVHLQVQTAKEKKLIWQECAPVKSILYDSPKISLQTEALMTAVDLYKNELLAYGYQSIPRFFRSKSFHERIDSALLLLCRQCPRLKILVITERISTATVLLIANTARNLRYLHIRGNAVILKCDWPQSPEWSDEFYEWLKFSSRSYERVEKEVSQTLGYNWRMLSDKNFTKFEVNLHDASIF